VDDARRCKTAGIGYYPPDRGIWRSFRAACPGCSNIVTVSPNGSLAIHRRRKR
jgi:hypothetical protein